MRKGRCGGLNRGGAQVNPAFFMGIIIFSATLEAMALGRARTADYTPGDLGFDPLRSPPLPVRYHSISHHRRTCRALAHALVIAIPMRVLSLSWPVRPASSLPRCPSCGRLYAGKPEATKRDLELKELNNGRPVALSRPH